MDKITKIFTSGEVLKAQDLNGISSKVNELVEVANSGNSGSGDITEALSKKVDKVSGKGLSSNDYTSLEKTKLAGLPSQVYAKNETYSKEEVDGKVVTRPLVLSLSESKSGTYDIGGDKLDIWERSVRLLSLPKAVNATKEYVISDEPLGFGTYLDVDSFIASSGKGLNREFFNFNYEITRFYINSNLQSCVVVKCKNAVAEDVDGLLHLRYCKFFGDVVEFDVTVPDSVNKESIALSIPPLKFNKKMAFSYITDDSYAIYQYIFSTINKRMIAKNFQLSDGRVLSYHLGMQGKSEFDQYVSEEFYPESFAQCTDGAGIKRRYATTVAAWGDKLKDQNIGQDVGIHWPWTSEKEFKLYFDFGFMCAYHDLIGYDANTTDTQERFDKCMADTVALFKEYVGRVPKLMVEPNGDHKYITYCQNNNTVQVITAQSGDPRIKKVYPFNPDFSLDKNDVAIERLFAYGTNEQYKTDLLNQLAEFNSATDKTKIQWLIGAAHRSSYWESELITSINRLYGAEGNDSLWFPTLEEFFEYWYMRTNTLSVKTVTGTGVHYKMYVPKGANFFYRDLSVLIDGVPSLDGVSVVSGENVFGTSFAINDGKLLVNLNFDEKLLERANRYVTSFESDYNKEYAYDDAYYFVQQLKAGLKEPYLQRLNQFVSPPTFESLKINNGSSDTRIQSVTLSMTYSGQAPSHYMASENSNFSGAVWAEYSDSTPFNLSDGYGQKTVYVKLKNVYGESSVKSATIEYLEAALTLMSISINEGASSATENVVSVKPTYVGTPTHYMLSERSDFSGASWEVFKADIRFTLSSGYGNKTLYMKLKNGAGQTESKSAVIEMVDAFSAKLNSITINNGDEFTDSIIFSVTFDTLNTITKYKIGLRADLSDCPDWKNWKGSPVSFKPSLTFANGVVTIYAQVGNTTSESAIKSDFIRVVQPVVVTGLILAGGEDNFAGLTVPVAFATSTGTPTHYRLTETESAITSAAWVSWNNNITHRFSSLGSKTLYGQVKNEVSESLVVSDTINLAVAPVKTILGWNASSNNTNDSKVVNGETINQIKFAIHTGFDGVLLKDTQGNTLNWKFNNYSGKYMSNKVFSDNSANNYETKSTATGDGGVYPDELFLCCQACQNNNIAGERKLRASFNLPIGRYKIRILYSPGDAFLVEPRFLDGCYYGVFEGDEQRAKVAIASAGFTGKANNQYNCEFEFDVLGTANDVDIAAWVEGFNQNYRPGINLIELTKLS